MKRIYLIISVFTIIVTLSGCVSGATSSTGEILPIVSSAVIYDTQGNNQGFLAKPGGTGSFPGLILIM